MNKHLSWVFFCLFVCFPTGAEEEGEVELMDSAEPSQFQDAEEME